MICKKEADLVEQDLSWKWKTDFSGQDLCHWGIRGGVKGNWSGTKTSETEIAHRSSLLLTFSSFSLKTENKVRNSSTPEFVQQCALVPAPQSSTLDAHTWRWKKVNFARICNGFCTAPAAFSKFYP